jgi:HK97 family phage major capsid protein
MPQLRFHAMHFSEAAMPSNTIDRSLLHDLESRRDSIRHQAEALLRSAQAEGCQQLSEAEDAKFRSMTELIRQLDERIADGRDDLDRAGDPYQVIRGGGLRTLNTAGRLSPLSFDPEELRSAYGRISRGETAVLEARAPGFSSADSLIPPTLYPVPTFPRHEARLLDRLPGFALESPSLEYVQVTSVTGAAGIVGEGQPKPEIETPATKVIVTALKLAAHVGISWENINDYDAFTAAVQNELLKQVIDLENQQLVYGDPTSGGLSGLTTTAGILTYTATGTTASPPNNFDDISAAIAAVRTGPALGTPDLLLLHPDTWAAVRTQKDTLGRYLATPDPTSETADTVWDVPVLQSTQFNRGDGILLDTSLFGRVAVRESLVMRMGYRVVGGVSDFTSNIVRWIAEERLNLAVERPAAVCWITGLPTTITTTAASTGHPVLARAT